MLFLSVDVPRHLPFLRTPDGESPIPRLPREVSQGQAATMHPTARSGFQVAEHVRNGHVGPELGEDVDMISGTVDAERNTAVLLDDEAESGVQVRSKCEVDTRDSALGSKHDVIEEIRVRVRHGRLPHVAHGSKPSPWALVVGTDRFGARGASTKAHGDGFEPWAAAMASSRGRSGDDGGPSALPHGCSRLSRSSVVTTPTRLPSSSTTNSRWIRRLTSWRTTTTIGVVRRTAYTTGFMMSFTRVMSGTAPSSDRSSRCSPDSRVSCRSTSFCGTQYR